MTVSCWECYVASLVDLMACPRHATAAERKAAERRVLALADRPHPVLAMLERKR